MTQLTSITNLRNSSAMQSRVENVMHHLKSLNPVWQPDWYFPIAIINVANDSDDCSWVRSHTSTHHKGDGMLYQGTAKTEASKVIENLKGFQARSASDYGKLNDLLTSAFGAPIDWTKGLGQGQLQEVAGVPAPFGQTSSTAESSVPSQPKSSVKVKKSTAAAKPTKLDEAKKLFSDLTPKQKVELSVWVQEKVGASKACQALMTTEA